jgi:hypothetical protein
MGLIIVFILGFLIFSINGRIAQASGRSPIVWGFISLVAYFVSYAVLTGFYMGAVYKGPMTPDGIRAFVEANPSSGLLILLFGFSGVLAVRYYLERNGSRRPKGDRE